MERIGLVGVGLMGRGMALNLLRAGHTLTVYTRREHNDLDRLRELGACETRDLGELTHQADVTLLCLSDAQAVLDVVSALEPGLRAGHLMIDATTSDPAVSRELAVRFSERKVCFADAPVTGGPSDAERARLGSLVGCDATIFPRVERVVTAYSKVVQRMGGVGAGHTAKLLNNFVTQGTVALLAEAYLRAKEFGVDWQNLYAAMEAGAARSGTLEKMVKPALSGNFDGSRFSIRNAAKDLDYFCSLSSRSRIGASELGQLIRAVFDEATSAGFGDRYVGALLDPQDLIGRRV